MKNYTHLFFDLDRTLWDFERNSHITFLEIYDQFIKPYAPTVDFAHFFEVYTQINTALWEGYRNGNITKEVVMVKRFSVTLEQLGIKQLGMACKISEYYLTESTRKPYLIDYAKEIISYLKINNYKLFIITNGFKEVQYEKMKHTGIAPFFDHVFISEEVGFMKPDRRFFESVLRYAGIQPEYALVIGDDYQVDIKGAMGAGIDQVYFSQKQDNINTQATYTISMLKELKQLLLPSR